MKYMRDENIFSGITARKKENENVDAEKRWFRMNYSKNDAFLFRKTTNFIFICIRFPHGNSLSRK